jgi:hypothetical protein
MIDFAVIALPRSGTAWSANWLGCPHEPTTLDAMSAMTGGFSSTALWLNPDFVYRNVKRWVILERDPEECRASMAAQGYPWLDAAALERFYALRGPRMHWTALFDPAAARDIWDYLRPDAPFDAERHARLCTLKVETRLRYD